MAETPEKDVVELLLDQHDRIRRLFEEVVGASTVQDKQELFDELRRLLAVHETAEEMVTHPRARMNDGNEVVDALLAEENEGKEMLADLDRMEAGDPGFDAALATLRTAVLAHAEHEERDEFPLLREHNDEKALGVMAAAVRAAAAIAPTHPHPRAGESLTTNAVAGPLASVVDRTRDAIRKVTG